jgi:hypothetical protein
VTIAACATVGLSAPAAPVLILAAPLLVAFAAERWFDRPVQQRLKVVRATAVA